MTYLVLVANAGDGTISTLRLTPSEDGSAAAMDVLATSPGGKGNSTIAVDARRNLVYTTYKPATDKDQAGIAVLGLDRSCGALTELHRFDVDAGLAYLDLSDDGEFLVGASYHGGFGAVWRVRDGVIGEQTSRVEFANVHCSRVVGDRVYFVALGDDLVAQYQLLPNGSLVALGGETVVLPFGSGPRHLVVDGANAYVVTEFSGEVMRLSVGVDGALSPGEATLQVRPDSGLRHSRFGADPLAEGLVWGADVHVAGRWLLASERNASTLAVISRDEQGVLGEVVDIVTTEKQPRGFGVTPDGRFVVAVGEKSTTARLYRVSEEGSLLDIGSVPVGAGANWVSFVDA
ncbi:lactonase family protein [Dermatophilus congolensis]|uniref:6-phosphogluconolactonase n=1 Tax=Dermatophilus congolensis TaxID=1863 RepID=A0A239V6Y8_9MICO|nr:beta-propeller fold lactonase family protein [Dermatophilus congolensis]MBO3130387.1 beta-propeller fold lactonase family protein [Dermatophilus congolensis]MBO3130982.1 beta-propeller fold lactonase family protein [Dermatophilus congolensis]MBO3134858.1 beta-propeller fold lactonase family protein [Dermatophilus congolensis]MBO3137095.1 beta-propeller fold lactonase family protein [Dermatophilus congolensis]MBO3139339.1 beta-propeller fold lactonase family protein [Dermatophilus congolensi